jgi:hypothetical protein
VAARTSLRRRGDHRVDAGVDARVERVAVHDEPDQARRDGACRGPELVGPRRRLELAQLESSSARTIRLRSRGRSAAGPRRAARELGVQRLGPRGASSASQRARTSPGAPGAGRARQRRAQVEAGAADHDRDARLREQRVDLGVRQLGVLADREARVDRQDRDQAVLQRGRARRPRRRR